MKFSELHLHADLMRGIEEAGFVDCTPVQEQTFRHTLHGGDVTVQSQTGSGKTAAFLITIFQQLMTNPALKGRKALVILPTRELADQIESDARKLGKYLPVRVGAFFGGVGYVGQEKLLAEGVDLMIGTPGRLLDFAKSRKIDFSQVGILIIDEADRLFDMGFFPDIRRMLRAMPAREKRLTMLLSATMSLRAAMLAWEYMNDPAEIVIEPENITVETISQHLYHVSVSEKLSVLLGILARYNPSNVLIFANTKHKVEELAKRLDLNGYKSHFIIGDLPQRKRLKIIDDLKEGRIRILVATDVAARGLHVDDLAMVVNYDLPEDAENYVHRIGRTARAGKTGVAVSLSCERYVYGLEAIEKFLGRKIPVEAVTDDLFAEDKSAGVRVHSEYSGRDSRRGERVGRGSRPGRGERPERGGRYSRGGKDGRSDRGDRAQRPTVRPGDRTEREATRRDVGERPRGRIRHGQSSGKPAGGAPQRPREQPDRRIRKPAAGQTPPKAPSAPADIRERLSEYSRKYGETFTQPAETAGIGEKPVGKLISFFKKLFGRS